MDLLKDMIKDVQKKIDSSNSNFCGTPLANTKKLSKRIAGSILLGQGNVYELLSTVLKEEDKDICHKNCKHNH